jgi:signal transduction histidine kinase
MTERPSRAYRMAFQAAPLALLAVDGTGVIRLASAEAERLLRRGERDLIGRPLDDVLTGDPTAPLRNRTAGQGPVLASSALRLPDHRQVPVDVRMRRAGTQGWVVLTVDDPGETVRSRAALENRVQRLAEAEREQESLLGDLIRAQERERARIAAGVHDDSLQVITAAMLRLQQLRRRLRDPDSLQVLARLEESIALAADRLRRLIFDLRPPALERSGLAAAIRDSLARLRDDAGVEVRLDDRLAAEPPLPTRLLLYRIIQEALVNVVKHAAAGMVEVSLASRENGYLVRVSDDGTGTKTERRARIPEPGHLGLVLMRERAEFAGGWFHIESAQGSGTTVTVWIPQGADAESTPRPPALRGVGLRVRGNGHGGPHDRTPPW